MQIIYLNGAELLRYNMPPGPVNSTTPSRNSTPRSWSSFNATGGWINNGLNTIAVEAHQKSNSSTSVTFEMFLGGQLEGLRC